MLKDAVIVKLFKGAGRAMPYVPFWVKYLPEAEINTPERLAAYFAQVAHETGNLLSVRENLNYSAKALANTWPKRYSVNPDATIKVPNDLAVSIANKPSAIANNCYANRMGNGNEKSGDGWKYRGRGLFQVTGKASYLAYSIWAYNDDRCVNDPDLLAQPEDAVRSSIWFWVSRNLSKLADDKDIRGITRIINGGYIGLPHRKDLYKEFGNILGVV
jgi:putative chitinase